MARRYTVTNKPLVCDDGNLWPILDTSSRPGNSPTEFVVVTFAGSRREARGIARKMNEEQSAA